jgi:hypothetical protein
VKKITLLLLILMASAAVFFVAQAAVKTTVKITTAKYTVNAGANIVINGRVTPTMSGKRINLYSAKTRTGKYSYVKWTQVRNGKFKFAYRVKQTIYLKARIRLDGRNIYSAPIKIIVRQTPSTNTNTNSNANTNTSLPSNIFGNYDNVSIEDIVNALPLIYDDSSGDYVTPPGGAPPSGVYQYPPIDADNIYAGVRAGRLYLKWTLGGTIPAAVDTVNGNTIKSDAFNMRISDLVDPDSSNACGGSKAIMQINIAYHDGQIWYNPWFKSVCNNTGPYGSEDEFSYANNGAGVAHTYNSGIGKTTIVYSFPLSGLNIAPSDALKIKIWSEAESNLWDHYSFDEGAGWTNWTVTGI